MRTLLLDIEASPIQAFVWGLFDQQIPLGQLIDTSSVLCYTAKWLGEKGSTFDSVHQSSKKKMLRGIHKMLSEADAVITYNGERYDIPVLNREFVVAKMPPPAPYKSIDMFRTVKRRFRFASNKMDHVNDVLGLPRKLKHQGFQLWVDCMANKPAAWKVMERYNRRDVRVLEAQYKRLLPWIVQHPNIGLYDGKAHVCPHCGSNRLQRRGVARTLGQQYARFQCLGCGAWSRAAIGDIATPDRRQIARAVIN